MTWISQAKIALKIAVFALMLKSFKMENKMRAILGILAVSFVLAGCSGLTTNTDVEKLNEAKAVGSPFTQRLTAEYRAYMKTKQKWLDYADAKHFAKKGLLAAEGQVVLPEPLSNWHLDDISAKEIRAARIELLQALNGGGRAMAPFEAALAQAKFDCWIEQAEQSWASNLPPACRAEFERAMAELNARLIKALPKSEKEGQPIPQAAPPEIEEDPNAIGMAMDEGMFLAFFDFDRSVLTDSGRKVVAAVAEQALKRNDLRAIRIVGHADTSGPDAYNQRLSERRAASVKAALVEKGVDAALIETSGMGEKSPMVQTPNNTREPANRRAEVTFE